MGDFALTWSDGSADLSIEDDDLASDEGLRTAAMLSLFTDRRANDDDVLPTDDGDKRGWWGDQFAEVQGDKHGSRMWLLERSKASEDIVPRAEDYGEEALAWMVEDKAVRAVDYTAVIEDDRLYHLVTFYRPDGTSVEFKFAHVWAGEDDREYEYFVAEAADALLTESGDTLITESGDTLQLET